MINRMDCKITNAGTRNGAGSASLQTSITYTMKCNNSFTGPRLARRLLGNISKMLTIQHV